MKSAPHARRQAPRESPAARYSRQRQDQSPSFTATEAKNEFGRILERAIQGETVVITKHDAPKAVLISVDRFNALRDAPELRLNSLSREFDALLARMQGAKARDLMNAAFHATPQQLGKAAVMAARKRG